jgi:hypothetical protein
MPSCLVMNRAMTSGYRTMNVIAQLNPPSVQ